MAARITMRKMIAAVSFLAIGFAAGYAADSISAVRAQTTTVTAVSTVDDNLAAVTSGGRMFTCSGVRSNNWTCRPVQLKFPE
jgi:hypothetical protein